MFFWNTCSVLLLLLLLLLLLSLFAHQHTGCKQKWNGCNGDATHSVITVFWKATAFPCWRPWTGVGTKTWFPYRPLLVMIVMCQPVEATAPRCDAGAGWVCEWHGRVWRGRRGGVCSCNVELCSRIILALESWECGQDSVLELWSVDCVNILYICIYYLRCWLCHYTCRSPSSHSPPETNLRVRVISARWRNWIN